MARVAASEATRGCKACRPGARPPRTSGGADEPRARSTEIGRLLPFLAFKLKP